MRYWREAVSVKYDEVEREMTYLVSEDECAKEDTLIGPLLQCNLEMGLGPVDVDEGDEESWDLDLCLLDDVVDEL